MDTLSITAAVLGITTFAGTSMGQVHDIIKDMAEFEEVIQDVFTGLTATLVPLASLREPCIPDSDIRPLQRRT